MTPNPAVLDTLLARVRAATGPDRDLDAALMRALVWIRADDQAITHALAEDALKPFTQRRHDADAVLRLTSSLDATTAAVASRGLGWQVDQTEGATVSDEHDQWHETCATPVLSLVGAWLVAEMERAAEA